MDNAPLPSDEPRNRRNRNRNQNQNNHQNGNHNNNNNMNDEDEYYDEGDGEYYDEEYYDDNDYNNNNGNYGRGRGKNNRYNRNDRYYRRDRYNNSYQTKNNAITLKTSNMGKANKQLANESLQKHMRNKPNQPLPPTRPAPYPPPNGTLNGNGNSPNSNGSHSNSPGMNGNDDTKSIKSESNVSTTGSTGSGRRTRPPISHTTSAQMRGFMTSNPGLNINMNQNQGQHQMQGAPPGVLKNNKVKKLMGLQRTKSDDNSHPIKAPMNQLRPVKL